MTSPTAPQTQPKTETAPQGFSAEDYTEAALTAALTAAVAAWLTASSAAILAGAAAPNLSMMLDGTRFTADAVRRIGEALDTAWRTVYARTGTDLLPYIGAYLEELPYRLTGLVKQAWRQASEALADAQAGFADIDVMRDAIREALSPTKFDGYINRVAASEANISVNFARHRIAANAVAQGFVVSKTWKTRRDARVRHTHKKAQGQTVPFNTPFWVGGFPMMHPGDPTAPPSETARCRCVSTYVVSERR